MAQGVKRGTVQIADSFDSHWILKPETGCWIWQRAARYGYGVFSLDGRLIRSAKYAYERKFGAIPRGLHVLHHCDTPACCNPDHLFLGTQADNMSDCKAKRRNNIGERNGGAKLTRDQVIEIRQRRQAGHTLAAIGADCGVTYQTIHKIVKGQKWTTVP